MPQVQLHMRDDTILLTLETMLTFSGHSLVEEGGPGVVHISDDLEQAVGLVEQGPVLVLSTAGDLAGAVKVMELGVFGYIFLPLVPGEAALMVQRAAASGHPTVPEPEVEQRSLKAMERAHILDTLRLSKYNRAEAARRLGIGRNTLWRKLKQYDIESK